jgi:ribosomal peptide maturation radical SAM protein 1
MIRVLQLNEATVDLPVRSPSMDIAATRTSAAATNIRAPAMAVVWMPFADTCVPSIQLGLLAGLVRAAGWRAETFHFNLDLAARIPEVYPDLCKHDDDLLGEWLFAEDAFGAIREESANAYLDYAARDLVTGQKDEALRKYLLHLREKVIPEFLDDCVAQVQWDQFQVVGFSSVFQQNVAALALARRLKERHDIVVVFGGANMHGEMGAAYLEAFPFIDHVAIGEADLCVGPLLQAVATANRAVDIPGIASRTSSGQATAKPPQLLKDLSNATVPDFDDYFARCRRLNLPVATEVPIETSRGCWWGERSHCVFCGLNGNEMRFRTKPEELVIKEVATLSERYGITAFKVTDNIMPRQYVETFFPQLRGSPFRFFFEVKSNLTREHLAVLWEGGVRWIQPGIESLSTDVLRLLRKGASKLHNIRLLKWCRWLGIRVSWNLLYGVPGETAEMYADQNDVMQHIWHLEPPEGCSRIRMDRFSPLFQSRNGAQFEWSRPWQAYRHVYPQHLDLDRAAYFFDFESRQILPNATHEPMFELVNAWRRAWSEQRPDLRWFKSGDCANVHDTRAGTMRVHVIDAEATRVLQECDDIRSFDSLGDLAGRACIEKLLDDGLLVRDGNLVLSLVLPGATD